MAEYIERSYIRKMAMFEMAYTMETETDAAVVLRMIDDAPAADVAPVVHGRWEDSIDEWLGTDVYTCSKCRESYVLAEGTPKENLWHYCPNCGAKMDIKDGGGNDAAD